MKASDLLHRLIQSLSRNEKRYVKLYMGRNLSQKDGIIEQMYDAMLKQQEYDEQGLKEGFAEPNRFAFYKNQLQEMVYDALVSFDSKSTSAHRLSRRLQAEEALFSRGHYRLASKELMKAKKEAVKYHLSPRYLEILKRESAILISKYAEEDLLKLEANIEETKLALEQVKNEFDFHFLYTRYSLLNKRRENTSKEEYDKTLESVINHPLMSSPDNAVTFMAKLNYNLIWSSYYMLKKDGVRMAYYYKKAIETWDDYPDVRQESILHYCIVTNNLLVAYSRINYYEEFPEQIEKIVAVSKGDVNSDSMMFILMNQLKIRYCRGIGDYQQMLGLRTEQEKGLQKFKEDIDADFEQRWHLHMATAKFVLGNYAEAQRMAKKIVDLPKHEIGEGLQFMARVFQLVMLYCSGKMDVFDYLLRTVSRKIDQKTAELALEDVIVQNLKALYSAMSDEAKTKKILKGFMEEARLYRLDNMMPGHFELACWPEALYTGRSLEHVIKDQRRETNKTREEVEALMRGIEG